MSIWETELLKMLAQQKVSNSKVKEYITSTCFIRGTFLPSFLSTCHFFLKSGPLLSLFSDALKIPNNATDRQHRGAIFEIGLHSCINGVSLKALIRTQILYQPFLSLPHIPLLLIYALLVSLGVFHFKYLQSPRPVKSLTKVQIAELINNHGNL